MRSKNLIACILLLLFSITVWAQESAMITGVVTDENKEPLIGVNCDTEYAWVGCYY